MTGEGFHESLSFIYLLNPEKICYYKEEGTIHQDPRPQDEAALEGPCELHQLGTWFMVVPSGEHIFYLLLTFFCLTDG